MKAKYAKFVFAVLVCAILICGTAFFTACGGQSDKPSGDPVLERIEVTKRPTKTQYVVGETFSRSGMVVTAFYSDGKSSPVMGYSVDKSGPLTEEDTNVTVTYKEKTDSFDIVVKPKEIVSHLKIESAATYTYKVEAEDCELASELIGTPKDEFIELHDATQGNPSTSGGKSLGKLNFSNNKISLRIDSAVEADISIDMSMAFNPTLDFDSNVKTEWNGERLTTGFVVAVDSGAAYAWFDWHKYTLKNLRLKAGVNELGLTVINQSANYDYFNINVNPVKSTLTGIEVTTPPTKTVYSEGERFDPTGMVVTATYADGTTLPVNDYTVDKMTLAVGDTVVTLTYDGQTATVPVTVNPRTAALESISVASEPIKKAYEAGDYFRAAGMTVRATYGDGTSETVTDFTVDDSKPLAIGDTAVTVAYGGKTTTVEITVAADSGTRHANISSAATASYRIEAEAAIVYKNRETDSWRIEEHGENHGDAYNPTTSGLQSLGYMNLTTTGVKALIQSEVEAPVSVTLRLAYNPELDFDAKTASYFNGEKLTTGFSVRQTDSTYDWFDWHYYTIGDLSLKKGVNVLEFITLGDMSVSYDCFDINVNPVTSIAVTTPPSKKTYAVGESFDRTGMIVTATYADGTRTVIDDFAVDTVTPLTADVSSVTVSYEGLTAVTEITVTESAALESIEITSQPQKTVYYGGETFDPTGMTVTARYADGATADVTNYKTDKTVLIPGDAKVTVTYGGKSTDVTVTVKTHLTFSDGSAGPYKLELEAALFVKGTGDKKSYTVADHETASGGKYLDSCDWLAGATFTVTIDSKVEGTVSISLSAASGNYVFDDNASVGWNGEAKTTGMHLDAGWANAGGLREYAPESLSGLKLEKGLNVFVLTLKTNASANFDYVSFTVTPATV